MKNRSGTALEHFQSNMQTTPRAANDSLGQKLVAITEYSFKTKGKTLTFDPELWLTSSTAGYYGWIEGTVSILAIKPLSRSNYSTTAFNN